MVTKASQAQGQANPASPGQPTPNANASIMICRNKHYPYIASYHGPWLSLPVELLQSLFALNNDVVTAPPPPPIDPIIFRHLINIRTLVDDASEMVIKAAGGHNVRGSSNTNPLGIPYNARDCSPASGRMSAIRQHRLRELAVSKLASAYRCDEIATSVLTMQSASALDDVAAKVLRRHPQNLDAIYVHHFHEKIPSRMLASSTDCSALDKLIAAYPTTPEYYRSRAMIHSFREEFPAALRDFKTAIALAKKRKRVVNGVDCEALVHGGLESRQHQQAHLDAENDDTCSEAALYFLRAACFHQYAIHLIDKGIDSVNDSYLSEKNRKKKKNKKKKKSASARAADAAAESRSLAEIEEESPKLPDSPPMTPSLPPTPPPAGIPLPTWNDYRDAMQPSVTLVENLARRSIRDYHHFLSYFPNSLDTFSGGASSASTPEYLSPVPSSASDDDLQTPNIGTMPDFLDSISPKSLTKLYCAPMSQVATSSPPAVTQSAQPHHHAHGGADTCVCYHNQSQEPEVMPALGTYHPLLTEAWFSIGVNHMLTRDWHTTAQWHDRIPALQDQVEGYPVFLPARSMSQADYIEIVTLLRKAARGDRTSKTTKSASTEETVSPQVSKPRTTENKDTSFSAASNTTTTTTGRSTTNAASPTVETKAAPTAAPSQSTASSTPLKQYPMYTKRAQTVSMWLQAMLTADREVAVPAVATASRKDVAPAEGAALVSDHEDI